nr:MAG TPA: hypothetical protein [Caudoviricetes sp.]
MEEKIFKDKKIFPTIYPYFSEVNYDDILKRTAEKFLPTPDKPITRITYRKPEIWEDIADPNKRATIQELIKVDIVAREEQMFIAPVLKWAQENRVTTHILIDEDFVREALYREAERRRDMKWKN